MYSFCIMRAALYFACYGACTRYFFSTRHIKQKHIISSVATNYIVPTNRQNYQYNVPLILMNMKKSIGRVTQWASKQYSMYHHRYNAVRLKTRHKGMASVRSRSLVTSNLKNKIKTTSFFAQASFYFFTKKNGKNASRTRLQQSNA